MKMFEQRIGLLPRLALVVVAAYFLFSLPVVFTKARKAAMGRSYLELVAAGMDREVARPLAYREGTPNAVFGILGMQLPITLLVMIAICLMSRAPTPQFRARLRWIFLCVAVAGCFFASVSKTFFGREFPFPSSLAPTAIVYLAISALLWLLVWIGSVCRRKHKLPVPRG